MGDEELEALWQGVISREDALKIIGDPLEYCETLVENVKKDIPRQLAKFLENQNKQFDKQFRNDHTEN